MLPSNAYWVYEADHYKEGREWLRLKIGEDTLASISLARDEKGKLKKKEVSLKIFGDTASKIEVLVSLKNSVAVNRDDKECLWNLREKLYLCHRIFPNSRTYIFSNSRTLIRLFNEYLKTPEGVRWFMRFHEEELFESLTPDDVMGGIQDGSITIN